MTCCKDVNVVQLEDHQSAAVNFGFDLTWVTDLVTKYGGDVLSLVLEAVRGGFSKDFVVELLEKFGPVILEFLVSLLNKQKMAMNMAGEVLQADKVGVIDSSILEILVQKYLPMIFEKYGEQIVQMLVEFILNSLNKK